MGFLVISRTAGPGGFSVWSPGMWPHQVGLVLGGAGSLTLPIFSIPWNYYRSTSLSLYNFESTSQLAKKSRLIWKIRCCFVLDLASYEKILNWRVIHRRGTVLRILFFRTDGRWVQKAIQIVSQIVKGMKREDEAKKGKWRKRRQKRGRVRKVGRKEMRSREEKTQEEGKE